MNEPKLLSVAIFDPPELPDKTRWGSRRVLLIELMPPNNIILPDSILFSSYSIRFSLYERGYIIARYGVYTNCCLNDKKRAFAITAHPPSISDVPPRPPTPKEIADLRHYHE